MLTLLLPLLIVLLAIPTNDPSAASELPEATGALPKWKPFKSPKLYHDLSTLMKGVSSFHIPLVNQTDSESEKEESFTQRILNFVSPSQVKFQTPRRRSRSSGALLLRNYATTLNHEFKCSLDEKSILENKLTDLNNQGSDLYKNHLEYIRIDI